MSDGPRRNPGHPALSILAIVGALAAIFVVVLGALMAYSAVGGDDMMDGMWDMMDGMGGGMMGGGGPETTGSARGEGDVRIVDFSFQPTVVTVTPATTITWSNEDSASHDAVGDDFDTGKLNKGDSQSVTFDTPGEYRYICTYHPSMEGRVVVTAQ